MTLDEAIKHCLEVTENYEEQAKQCDSDDRYERHVMHENAKCATYHRQIAQWLTDYKELKNSIGAVKLSDMKESLELIREYKAENIAQKKLIAEYKRLLKAAVEGFNFLGAWMDEHGDCTLDCSDCPLHKPGYYCRGWNKEDEALALIGEDGDTNG